MNSTVFSALKVTSQSFFLFCVCFYQSTNVPGFQKVAAPNLAGKEEKGNGKLELF